MFIPQDTELKEEYETGWKITDAMPVYTSGMTTGRDALAIDMDEATLRNRIAKLRGNQSDGEVAAELKTKDFKWWNLKDARQQLQDDPNWENHFQRILYRPFDIRHVYYHSALVDGPRWDFLHHMLSGENIGLATSRQVKSGKWKHCLAASKFAESTYISNRTSERYYFFPLYLYPGKSLSSSMVDAERRPNFSAAFLKALGLPQSDGLPSGVSPEDIFGYIYSVLHSPEYRKRYRDFLRIDFPRIPLPRSLDLFRQLSALGQELVSYHLLNHPDLQNPAVQHFGKNRQVVKVGWTKENGGTVWLDGQGNRANFRRGTSGFAPVPEEVWKHHIGGYQVCEKWLKDRIAKKGQAPRNLSDADLLHYRRIVAVISSTIHLMSKIDTIIHSHGNFEGA